MLLVFQYAFQISSVWRSSSCFISADSQQSVPLDNDSSHNQCISYGGGRQYMLTFEEIGSHIIPGPGQDVNHDSAFKFIDHVDSTDGVAYPADQNLIYTDVPLPYLIPYLSLKMGLKIAALHNINLDPRAPKSKS